MKNIKKEKGITIIALVITIIVLLILAGVAISMLSGENGILNQAVNAKTRTEKMSTDEQVKLAAMAALIAGNGSIEGEEAYKALNEGLKEAGYIGEEITELPKTITINGNDYIILEDGTTKDSSNEEPEIVTIDSLIESGEPVTGTKVVLLDANNEQIVVPVGFKIKNDSPTEVKKGIVVVAPDGSEFVWVPVKDITKMATETGEKDTKGRTNYQGKLYEFTSTDGVYSATEKTSYGQGTTSYREPSLVTGSSDDTKAILKEIKGTSDDADRSYYNGILGYDSAIEFGKAMQEDYNDMIESVKINKGFYVGRYETSLNETTKYAQSKSGETSATAADTETVYWYGLYQKQKEYSEKNTTITNSVGSSMIWGSQYDQMMMWMQSNGIDVTLATPTNLEGITTKINETQTTGSELKDKLNNIYDLLGNSFEWTLEASYAVSRVYRGGFYGASDSPSYLAEDPDHFFHYSYSPSYRASDYLDYTNNTGYYGSRLTLYVK